MAVHQTFETLHDYAGIVPVRYVEVPAAALAWIDATFGGTLSLDVAAGSAYVASDAGGYLGFVGFDARSGAKIVQSSALARGAGIAGPLGFMKRAHPELQIAMLHAALLSLRERGYVRAVVRGIEGAEAIAFLEREAGAAAITTPQTCSRPVRTVALASGNGSNFAAVLAASRSGAIPLQIDALVANRYDAFAVERARDAGVPAVRAVWDRTAEPRPAYDARLLEAVAAYDPELILLLGWMHVLPAAFLQRFPEALNLHPAYLPLDPAHDEVTFPDGSTGPSLRGAHAVDDALALGLAWTGATLHRLGHEVDRGEVLARAPLRLHALEPREALMERLHALEHRVAVAGLQRWVHLRDASG